MGQSKNSYCRTIEVDSVPRSLAEVRRFVDDVSNDLGLSEEHSYDLKVAVSEASANAIEHSGGADILQVCATRFSDRLTIDVVDAGNFRLSNRQSGAPQHRGLGLPLMVALMDEVRVYRNEQGGTTVALTIFLKEDGEVD